MRLRKQQKQQNDVVEGSNGNAAATTEKRGPVATRHEAHEQPSALTARRRSRAWRTRDAGAAAAGTVGAGFVMLARLVMTVAALIALLILLAIVLVDVGANPSNTIVKGIHEGANFFAGSFTGLLRYTGHPKRAISVNWGIALLVYLVVGAIVARLIFNVGRGLRSDRASARRQPATEPPVGRA
jgi:hypothetical protein